MASVCSVSSHLPRLCVCTHRAKMLSRSLIVFASKKSSVLSRNWLRGQPYGRWDTVSGMIVKFLFQVETDSVKIFLEEPDSFVRREKVTRNGSLTVSSTLRNCRRVIDRHDRAKEKCRNVVANCNNFRGCRKLKGIANSKPNPTFTRDKPLADVWNACSNSPSALLNVACRTANDLREISTLSEVEPALQIACVSHEDTPLSISNSSTYTKEDGMRWSMLLSTGVLEDAHLTRASSVTDSHVLRRKGRLKEQDGLTEFIISMHSTHSPAQVMEKMEKWVREHLEDPQRSKLKRLVPSVGRFYTPLPLFQALQEYDEFSSLSRRRYVPPNFAEIRHVLNIAQVHATAGQLSLLTFDADGTLYADGHHIVRDNKMIGLIIKLMQEGIHIAIVTAAGYPNGAARYEGRLAGLLDAFKELRLPRNITELFHVMGGECNYLLRVNRDYQLEFVSDNLWKTSDMLEWAEKDIEKLLQDAKGALVSAASRLQLPVEVIQKPRAVGAIPKEATIYEVLEEMALSVQVQLLDSKLPFCAFNGGNDVFVDVGNKSVGLEALMKYLQKASNETLHVGDRFTVSGNDSATRSKCPILWVANPEETAFFIGMLLQDVQQARRAPVYIE